MSASQLPDLYQLSDLLTQWGAEAQSAHAAKQANVPRGPVTGLPELDRAMGGFLAPGQHVLHGMPGAGKTALALQIAATCGYPALYVTSEMRPLELFYRVAARTTQTFLGSLRDGSIDPARSLALAHRAVAAAPNLALADATMAPATCAWLATAATGVRGTAPHMLIVIDSVHSWSTRVAPNATEYERLAVAITELGTLAQTVGCPILAIAERNRASMKGGGMNAAAGHRSFEYSGESVIDLTTDDPPILDANQELGVTLMLAKNRHGTGGQTVRLKFSGRLQQFREATP